eukprot:762424-Hanusia_phi.AAC.7
MGIRIQLMSTMKESSRFQALAKYPASSGSTVEDRGGLKPTPSAAILRNISAVNTETMIQSKILLMSLSLDVGLKSSLMSFMAISTVLKNISPEKTSRSQFVSKTAATKLERFPKNSNPVAGYLGVHVQGKQSRASNLKGEIR